MTTIRVMFYKPSGKYNHEITFISEIPTHDTDAIIQEIRNSFTIPISILYYVFEAWNEDRTQFNSRLIITQ